MVDLKDLHLMKQRKTYQDRVKGVMKIQEQDAESMSNFSMVSAKEILKEFDNMALNKE